MVVGGPDGLGTCRGALRDCSTRVGLLWRGPCSRVRSHIGCTISDVFMVIKLSLRVPSF